MARAGVVAYMPCGVFLVCHVAYISQGRARQKNRSKCSCADSRAPLTLIAVISRGRHYFAVDRCMAAPRVGLALSTGGTPIIPSPARPLCCYDAGVVRARAPTIMPRPFFCPLSCVNTHAIYNTARPGPNALVPGGARPGQPGVWRGIGTSPRSFPPRVRLLASS